MSVDPQRPAREVQALAEVGATSVSRGVAWWLVLAFAFTVFGVAVLEPWLELVDGEPGSKGDRTSVYGQTFTELGVQATAALGGLGHESVFSVNRSLLEAMHRFEDRLEEQSFLRRWLLPRLQWRLAATVGLGNEQVYVGRDSWLFFRSDVDYVIGRGFLDRAVQDARERGGDAWLRPLEPDPLPALLDLQRQLHGRKIHLIVMPTPVKPTVEPERFSGRAQGETRAFQNPSFREMLDRLSESGIDVFDPAPLLIEARLESGDEQYLRTDTHWTPLAVGETARELGRRIAVLLEGSPEPGSFTQRPVVVEGLGDIAGMLWLPPDQQWMASERVTAQRVLDRLGRTWRAEKGAEILLLGDSFSNVYSDSALGWGAGAGLAEQLSYFLQVPVDKLAVNAGGALQSRQSLKRVLAIDADRLTGKRVLVYQFASRELAKGDWQLVELAESGSTNR